MTGMRKRRGMEIVKSDREGETGRRGGGMRQEILKSRVFFAVVLTSMTMDFGASCAMCTQHSIYTGTRLYNIQI